MRFVLLRQTEFEHFTHAVEFNQQHYLPNVDCRND
jgi:hypothetical protein